MDFGKLPNVDQVDFSLPDIPDATKRCLATEKEKELRVYLGCTGWSMKDWVGTYYPPGTKSQAFLKAYSRQFNTIEMNTTHYRIPDFATVERWKNEATADFQFCPKLPQGVSHRNDLGMVSGQLDAFINNIAGLESKLGPCFLQLPPYFAKDRFPLLRNFIKAWPAELRLAIEFRHADWFNDPADMALFDLFKSKQIVKLITDVAGRRDVLHMQMWRPFTLLRFVGNDFHDSDYSRMDAWIDRIVELKELGLQQIFFFAHQPDNVRAPEAIQYLLKSLKTKPGVICKAMLPNFNSQLPLF